MPSEQQLEYEITLARHDLEANLAELQIVVREKLDVRRHAREALERVKVRARALLTRKVVVAATAVAVLLAGLVGYRHRHSAP
jgi:hypothetical protein